MDRGRVDISRAGRDPSLRVTPLRIFLYCALLTALVLVAGCGQKGNLVLPGQPDDGQPIGPPEDLPGTIDPVIDGGAAQPR